jgi:hypothetical protein
MAPTSHSRPCFDCDALIDYHRRDIPHCDCGSATWPCEEAAEASAPALALAPAPAPPPPPRALPPCGHRRCSDDECYKLSSEEIDPTNEDLVLGKKLVDEGWLSTSARYRTIGRWRNHPPKIVEMLLPEYRDSPFGRYFIARYGEWYGPSLRNGTPEFEAFIERKELTLPQFRGFKKAGGRCS